MKIMCAFREAGEEGFIPGPRTGWAGSTLDWVEDIVAAARERKSAARPAAPALCLAGGD